jgi:hypothetical protein
MIRLPNFKQVCFSKTWPQWVPKCKPNLKQWCKKNAWLGCNLFSWVTLICLRNSKKLFKLLMLLSKKESLLNKRNKTWLLICKLKLIRPKLQLPLLLTRLGQSIMHPLLQMKLKWNHSFRWPKLKVNNIN